MAALKLLIVDDHALFREGLRLVLKEGLPDIDILEAASLEQAMHAAPAAEPPDLVLLDIQLQGVNGNEGLGLLGRRWPGTPVVMLSSIVAAETVALARARGAAAFVSKGDNGAAIIRVIRQTLAAGAGSGDAAPPAGRRARTVADAADTADAADGNPPPRLTPRQCEVLDLLCEGLSNKMIARRLGLSEFTVRGHVQAILGLLGVTSRSQATFAARRHGLVA